MLKAEYTIVSPTSCENESFYIDKIKYLEALVKKYKFDYLTELMGKRDCTEKMDELFEEYLATDELFYFGLVDIDNLHNINRTYGYYAGDEAIKATAEELKKHFQFYEIYRISGDEFVVIIRNAKTNIDRINDSLNKIDGVTHYVTNVKGYRNPKEMFKTVDKKLTDKKKTRHRL